MTRSRSTADVVRRARSPIAPVAGEFSQRRAGSVPAAGCPSEDALIEVRTAHTADLPAATLAAVRALLDAVFEGDMSDHDWEHALGGVHALVWEENEVVGHGSVVQRRLVHGGQGLRTGYVEGVGVRADRRRRGHGAAMMHALERVVRGAYELGALAAPTRPRTSMRRVAGICGRERPRRSPRPASRVPRRRTDRSTSFRCPLHWTCPVS